LDLNHIHYWLDLFSTYGWVLIIIVMERIWYIYRQPLLRKGLISDIIYTYQNIIIQVVLAASAPVVIESIIANGVASHFFPTQGNGLLQGALTHQPLWLNLLALVLVGEIAFYTVHYTFHKVPILWEFHRVHHSSVILDSFSTSRFHIFERILFTAPTIICMLYFGARLEAIVIYMLFRSFMDRYIHSNINGPRWTHKFMLSSPHFHRWHHAVDREAWDKNFSGDFIFLDVLFGTAYDPDPKDKPPPHEFGDPNYSHNFFVQQVMPFITIYQRFRKRKPWQPVQQS